MEDTLQKILSREHLSTKKFDKILCEVLFQNEQNVIEPYPIDVISGPESSEMRTVVVIFKCPPDICDHLIRLQNKTSKKKSEIKDQRIVENEKKRQIINENGKMSDINNSDTILDDTKKAEDRSKEDISSKKDQLDTERSNQDGNAERKGQEHAETEGKKAEVLLKENDAETSLAEVFPQEKHDNKTTSQRVNVEPMSFDTHEGKLGQGNQGITIPNEDHIETNSKIGNELEKLQGNPVENIAAKNCVETTSQGRDQQKSLKNNEPEGSVHSTLEKASDNGQFHCDPSSISKQEGGSIDAAIHFQTEDTDSNSASNDPFATHEPAEVERGCKFEGTDEDVINGGTKNKDAHDITKSSEEVSGQGPKVLVSENEEEKGLLLCESDVDKDGEDNEKLFEFTEEQRRYIYEGKTFLARKCRRRHLRRIESQDVETLDTFEILRRMREKTKNILSRQDVLNNKIKTRTYVK